MSELIFPTELHRTATEVVKDFFLLQRNIDTILLVNSLARGKATAESDIDIAVLITETTNKTDLWELQNKWLKFLNADPLLKEYKSSTRFAQIHLDIIEGNFTPAIWEDSGSIDLFEVEIGNTLVYSMPLTVESGAS